MLKMCEKLAPKSENRLVSRGARSILSTVGLSAALVAYANADAWLEERTMRPLPDRVNLSHLSVLAFVLAWASAERISLRDLGIARTGARRSLRWGLAAGAFGSIAVTLFFAFPLVSREAVTHPDFRRLSFWRLIWTLCGQVFLSTAVFEEVAFRGLLHAKLTRLFGLRWALAIGAGLFSLWHATIAWYNLRRSNLPRRWRALLYVGAMLNFWVAGLMFGLLRERTGHLAGSVLAHWLIVSNMVVAAARPRRPPV